MERDALLYLMAGLGAGAALGAGYYSRKNNELLERIVKEQPVLQIENIIGDSLPEKFLVIKGDTLYLQIGGKPIINYFTRTR